MCGINNINTITITNRFIPINYCWYIITIINNVVSNILYSNFHDNFSSSILIILHRRTSQWKEYWKNSLLSLYIRNYLHSCYNSNKLCILFLNGKNIYRNTNIYLTIIFITQWSIIWSLKCRRFTIIFIDLICRKNENVITNRFL